MCPCIVTWLGFLIYYYLPIIPICKRKGCSLQWKFSWVRDATTLHCSICQEIYHGPVSHNLVTFSSWDFIPKFSSIVLIMRFIYKFSSIVHCNGQQVSLHHNRIHYCNLFFQFVEGKGVPCNENFHGLQKQLIPSKFSVHCMWLLEPKIENRKLCYLPKFSNSRKKIPKYENNSF